MANNDFGGLKADRLRVKITQEGKSAGRFIKYGGQIGFKSKDGKWTNVWIDLMVSDGSQLTKGDVVNVSGGVNLQAWESNGMSGINWTIWADDMGGHQPTGQTSQQEQRPCSQQRRDEDLGPAFPAEASGMDDCPF